MGNCLGSSSTDDISLLRDNAENETATLGPPPPYQVRPSSCVYQTKKPLFYTRYLYQRDCDKSCGMTTSKINTYALFKTIYDRLPLRKIVLTIV